MLNLIKKKQTLFKMFIPKIIVDRIISPLSVDENINLEAEI